MASPTLSASVQKELVARWSETGRVLEALRNSELADQSVLESQRAAFDMLQLGGMLPDDPTRVRTSRLIEMQRLFAHWHGGGWD